MTRPRIQLEKPLDLEDIFSADERILPLLLEGEEDRYRPGGRDKVVVVNGFPSNFVYKESDPRELSFLLYCVPEENDIGLVCRSNRAQTGGQTLLAAARGDMGLITVRGLLTLKLGKRLDMVLGDLRSGELPFYLDLNSIEYAGNKARFSHGPC